MNELDVMQRTPSPATVASLCLDLRALGIRPGDTILVHAMQQLSLAPEKTLMIGDTKFDVLGAKENGLDTIAVSYGYGNWEETLAAEPTYTCDSVATLGRELVRLTSR